MGFNSGFKGLKYNLLHRSAVKMKYEVTETRIKRTGVSDTGTFICQIKHLYNL